MCLDHGGNRLQGGNFPFIRGPYTCSDYWVWFLGFPLGLAADPNLTFHYHWFCQKQDPELMVDLFQKEFHQPICFPGRMQFPVEAILLPS